MVIPEQNNQWRFSCSLVCWYKPANYMKVICLVYCLLQLYIAFPSPRTVLLRLNEKKKKSLFEKFRIL